MTDSELTALSERFPEIPRAVLSNLIYEGPGSVMEGMERAIGDGGFMKTPGKAMRTVSSATPKPLMVFRKPLQ